MAIFHLSTKPIQRSAGRSAVAAAAYRSAIKLTDETTGTTFNYEKKHNNVVKSECFLFADGQKILVDRSSLWNEAERSEKRKDARTAREIIINLPHEVDDEHRELLVNQFTEQLAKRYQVAIDWAIHRPDKGGDQRNHHAHIMMTTRTAELKNNKICLNEKSVLELSNSKLTKLNQPLTKDQITQIRSDYAALTNELFLSLGIDERVDHRSNVERGLDTLPTKKMGQEATALERKGTRTVRGDYNRQIKRINQQIAQEQAHERELTDQLNNAVIELEQATSTAESTITNTAQGLGKREQETDQREQKTNDTGSRIGAFNDRTRRFNKRYFEYVSDKQRELEAAQQAEYDDPVMNTPINRLFGFKVAMQLNDQRTITSTLKAFEYLTANRYTKAHLTCYFGAERKELNALGKMSNLTKQVFNSFVNGKLSLSLNDKVFNDFSTMTAKNYFDKYKIKYDSESDRNELQQRYEQDKQDFEQYQAKQTNNAQNARQEPTATPDQPQAQPKAAPKLEQQPGQSIKSKFKP